LVAVVVSAWFALGARQAIDTQRAAAIASRGNAATTAQEREVASLVRAARELNPDKQPDVLLGEVEVEHHDYARARRVLEAVTRLEPQSVAAWVWLVQASRDEPRLFLHGLHQLHVLEPRLP
jgi:hypothetical protein